MLTHIARLIHAYQLNHINDTIQTCHNVSISYALIKAKQKMIIAVISTAVNYQTVL